MAVAPAKFTFDLDMGQHSRRTRALDESQMEALLTAARSEGYAEGVVAGEHSATSLAAARLTASAELLANQAVSLLGRVDAIEKRLRSEAVNLAVTVGKKLAAQLVAHQPAAELDHLIEECLASIERAPHLVIRCNDVLAGKLREITEAHIAAGGFSGRLIVLADPEIAVGDGRLEWADGGLVRDMAATAAEIDTSIRAYLQATGTPAPSGDKQ